MQIQNLILSAQQPGQLLEFYTQVLELPKIGEDTVRVGSSTLAFEPARAGETPFYHFAFNIPHNQLQEAKAWAETRVTLIPDAKDEVWLRSKTWEADMFYFYDPAGNILEFIARHTLANSSSQPFSVSSLLSISEIGLVCEDVPTTVAKLQSKTEAPIYRTEVNETFVPLGDENGLFIVVRQGRIWAPDTGKAAMVAPFKVVLENGQTISEKDL